jgi:hypothetical protein
VLKKLTIVVEVVMELAHVITNLNHGGASDQRNLFIAIHLVCMKKMKDSSITDVENTVMLVCVLFVEAVKCGYGFPQTHELQSFQSLHQVQFLLYNQFLFDQFFNLKNHYTSIFKQ